MKPERSELIEETTGPWTVKPQFIMQEFEHRSYLHATKFAEFVQVATENCAEVQAELFVEGPTLTVELSPVTGDALTKATYDFVRGINEAYRIFHAPSPPSTQPPE